MKPFVFQNVCMVFIVTAGLVALARWFHPAVLSGHIPFILLAVGLLSGAIAIFYD